MNYAFDINILFFDPLMPIIYWMCVLSFVLFAYDKHLATYGKWRIPEWVLFIPAAALGAFGALSGMVFFNHKTNKKAFYITIPVLLFVQILALAFALTR